MSITHIFISEEVQITKYQAVVDSIVGKKLRYISLGVETF